MPSAWSGPSRPVGPVLGRAGQLMAVGSVFPPPPGRTRRLAAAAPPREPPATRGEIDHVGRDPHSGAPGLGGLGRDGRGWVRNGSRRAVGSDIAPPPPAPGRLAAAPRPGAAQPKRREFGGSRGAVGGEVPGRAGGCSRGSWGLGIGARAASGAEKLLRPPPGP